MNDRHLFTKRQSTELDDLDLELNDVDRLRGAIVKGATATAAASDGTIGAPGGPGWGIAYDPELLAGARVL